MMMNDDDYNKLVGSTTQQEANVRRGACVIIMMRIQI